MKKGVFFFFGIAIFWGLFQSCDPKDQEITGGIYGVVTDKATGEPIKSAGVTLTPNGATTVTGSDGHFEFTDLTHGGYAVVIAKTGYQADTTSMIVVESGKTTHVDILIEKLPPSLTILDDEGNEVTAIDFGENPALVMQSFYIFNKGEEELEWSVVYSCSWISSISKEYGVLAPNKAQPLVIKIDRNKLNMGNNSTTIHIVSNNGTRQINISASSNNIVETMDATDVRAGSAVLNGKITRDMSPSINEYGFVYSKKAAPTLQNGSTKITLLNTPTIGAVYNTLISNLEKETTYYARAYVSNGTDIAYGEQISFATIEGLPIVKTLGSSNVTSSSAIIQCEATDDRGESIISRGVCYATSPQPSIQGVHTSDGKGLGLWESSLTNLSPNATYYIRAYATNKFGTSYGEQLKIQTSEGLAEVRTIEISSITSNSAICTGEVISDGDRQVTERGICWKKGEGYPTVKDSHVANGKGTGTFSCTLTGLESGAEYHARAYATNSAGTVYGKDIAFTTKATKPEVSTTYANYITSSSAYIYGSVKSTGGANITEAGFIYIAEGDYYGKEIKTQISNGSFSVQLTDLEPNTRYYFQAYATNSYGTGVGEILDFTTDSGSAKVSTKSSSNIGPISATVTGEIISDGGFTITECGFCYSSTNKEPTIADNCVRNNTGVYGEYSCELTNLSPSTKYYVTAYAKNKNGIVYGTPIKFTTTDGMPSISILQLPSYGINNDATVYGKINSTGGVNVEFYGVVFSFTNRLPSIESKDAVIYDEGNPLSNTLTYKVNGIPDGSIIYYRFFIVNSLAKIAYSETGTLVGL